jgi:hypothetical protein
MGTRKKNPNAAALGSLGGKARAKSMGKKELSRAMTKAAKARMGSMTEIERKRVASQAAKARWAKARKDGAK